MNLRIQIVFCLSMIISTTIMAQQTGRFNFTTNPSAPSDYNWLPAGALKNSFVNVDNTGLNISMELTGATGTLASFPGQSNVTPMVSTSGTGGAGGALTLATTGFGPQGITIKIVFSQPVIKTDFKLFHINGSSYSGDLCTISAQTVGGNTIYPTFTPSAFPSYVVNSPSIGQIDATAASTAGDRDEVGVAFSDNRGINSITIVWSNCTTCGENFHGLALINQLNFTLLNILPVELVNFTANRDANNAGRLTWKTASEANNKGFEVEHAKTNLAEQVFETIGFVKGAGTTTHEQNYSYLTKQLSAGTHYFRIKQVDFDGTSTYSPIQALTVKGKEQTITMYPNPMKGITTIELGELIEGRIEVEIVDLMGKIVFANNYNNKQLIHLDLSVLPAAYYWVTINTVEGKKVMKLIKQ